MAIIYSYPIATPKSKDLLVGTSVFDENDPSSERTNPTVSFTVQSLINLIGPIIGTPNLQQVTGAGSTTTNSITIANSLSVNGSYIDSYGQSGSNGQVLTSQGTGTQTRWLASSGGVTSITPSDSTFITITQNATVGAITTTSVLSATGLSATPAVRETQYLRGDNTWAIVSTGTTYQAGAGLTLDTSTTPDTFEVDYLGTDNIILSAGTAVTPVGGDTIIINDATTGNVVKALISNLPFDTYNKWVLTGDNYDAGVPATSQDILSGNTVDIAGGTYITTAASATDTLTVTHDATARVDTNTILTPAFGATIDAIYAIGTTTTGHVSTTTYGVTIPSTLFGAATSPGGVDTVGTIGLVPAPQIATLTPATTNWFLNSSGAWSIPVNTGDTTYDLSSGTDTVLNLNSNTVIVTAIVNGDATASLTVYYDNESPSSTIANGQLVTGVGIPAGTRVVSFTASELTLNQQVTVSNDVALSFFDVDTVAFTAGNNVTLTGTSNSIEIASSYIDTGITGVTLATNSTGTWTLPLSESITGRELTLTSNVFGGGAKVGYVPVNTDGTQFLRGDGNWASIPTGLNYEGVWEAGTIGTTSAPISSTTITLTTAPTQTLVVGMRVTGTGINPGTTVLISSVTSQTEVVVNTSVSIASGVQVTFSTAGGFPDLTVAGTQGDGILYICTVQGFASPNDFGTPPSFWNVGDWCVFTGTAGTGEWTRIPATNAGVTSATTADGSFIEYSPVLSGSAGAITIGADLSATGTASATSFLRGDNSWSTALTEILPLVGQSPNYGGIIVDPSVTTSTFSNTASTASVTLVLTVANAAIETGWVITGDDIDSSGGAVTVTTIVGSTLTLSAAQTIALDATLFYTKPTTSAGTVSLSVDYLSGLNVVSAAYPQSGTEYTGGSFVPTKRTDPDNQILVYNKDVTPRRVEAIDLADLPFAPYTASGTVQSVTGLAVANTTPAANGAGNGGGITVSASNIDPIVSVKYDLPNIRATDTIWNVVAAAPAITRNINSNSEILVLEADGSAVGTVQRHKISDLPATSIPVFTGITGCASTPPVPVAGSTGLVPAPTTVDCNTFLRSDSSWGHAISSLLTGDGLKGGPISQSGTVSVEYSGELIFNTPLNNVITSANSLIIPGAAYIATDDLILISDTDNSIAATSNGAVTAGAAVTLTVDQYTPTGINIEAGLNIYDASGTNDYYGVVTAASARLSFTCNLDTDIADGVDLIFRNNTEVKKALVSQLPFVPFGTSFISTVTADNGLKIGGTSSNPIVEASYTKAEFEVNGAAATNQKTFTLTLVPSGIIGATVKNITGQAIGVVASTSGFTVTCVANLAFAVVDGEMLTFSTKPKNLITAAPPDALGILAVDEMLVLSAASGLVERKPIGDLPGSSGTTNLGYTASTTNGTVTSSTGTNATLPLVVAAGNAGLMTGADKTKLNGIAAGAQVNVGTDLSKTTSTTNVTINSSTGTNVAIGAATTSVAGVMTKALYDNVILNNAKVGITTTQADEITANTAKVTDTGIPAVITSGANPGVTSLYADTAADTVRATIGAGRTDTITMPNTGPGEGGILLGETADATTGILTYTVGVDYLGGTNIISTAYAGSGTIPTTAHIMWAEITGTKKVYYSDVADLPFASSSASGTVTSISALNAGVLVSASTTTPTVGVNYGAAGAGGTNLILEATDKTGIAPQGSDQILVSDTVNSVLERYEIDDLPFSNNAGTVTSVAVTAGTGITASVATSTTTPNITITNSAPDTGTPAILSNGTVPTLNSGITAAEVRTLIGAGTSSTTGTVTSVGTAGTVSGLTLTGTVTSTGNLTLGGTLSLTSANVTDGLGYTPLQSETDTLADVTGRGASTSTACSFTNTGAQTFGSGGSSDVYLGNAATNKFIRFHTNNINTYFDMNCGFVYWRQASSTRFEQNMVNGTFTASGDVVAFGSPSDKRLKENIKPIESALDKAMKLQGVTFDWKKSDSILSIKKDIGFIAQDVQKVAPELVRENEDGYLSMRHQGITPILLEAIKELKAEIEELKLNKCNCNK